jgi:hypothetical protein
MKSKDRKRFSHRIDMWDDDARTSLSISPASRILILQWQPIARRACAGPVPLSRFGRARGLSRTPESGA